MKEGNKELERQWTDAVTVKVKVKSKAIPLQAWTGP